MIVENKKQPEIRISGFNEKWEKRKFGDYIIPYNKVTTKNNQYPVFTSSRKGLFFQKDYYDGNQIASDDNTGYNIVPRGYFTYRHMSDDLVFKFNINNLADNGIVSTLYPVFKTTKELDSKYLQYQLNEGNEFKRYAILQKQGGSRTYMYLSKLKNMYLTIPKVDEQIKLSVFFKEFDDFISLHQQELTTLKQTKQGFLQKMFPKEGEKVPEVRFPGFTDDWEQRKLADLAEYYDGTHQTPKYTKSGVPFVSVENINNIKRTDKYISEEDFENQFKIKPKKDDILMTRITAGVIGDTTIVPDNNSLAYYVSLALIRPKKIMASYLEKYIGSNQFKEELHKRIIHTAFPKKINLGEIGQCIVSYPSNDSEQKIIGSFFEQLDETIVLHQRELELLQLTKKAFLQKLFV